MIRLLLIAMLMAATIQTGINIHEVLNCQKRECLKPVDKATKNVLSIDWKPISVFPEEAQRFR
jgi:hypothetical protein